MNSKSCYIFALLSCLFFTQKISATNSDSVKHQVQLSIAGNYFAGLGINHNVLIYRGNKFLSISHGLGSSSSPFGMYFIGGTSYSINQELGMGFKIKRSDFVTGVSCKLDLNFRGSSSKYRDRMNFFIEHPVGSVPYNPKTEPFLSVFCKYQYNFNRLFAGLNVLATYSYAYFNEKRVIYPMVGCFVGIKLFNK